MDFVQSRFPAMRTLTVSPHTPREKAATSSDRRRASPVPRVRVLAVRRATRLSQLTSVTSSRASDSSYSRRYWAIAAWSPHGLVDFLDDIEDADRFGDQRRYIEVLLEALKPAQERLRLHPVLPPGVEHDLDGHGTAHAFIHKVVGLPQREGLREHPGRARLHLNQGVSVDGHPEQHHKQRQQYFGIPDIDQVDPAEETVEDGRRSDPDRR